MSSLNQTPAGERLHIGIFGRRNAGKSSLLNAITGQDMAVVSPVKGTTTDPVSKAMELPPIGPVLIIDTAGTDDRGELGKLRMAKTNSVLRKTDIALLAADAAADLSDEDKELINTFEKSGIKYLIVYNKSDLAENLKHSISANEIFVSCKTGENINALKIKIAEMAAAEDSRPLVRDLINRGDVAALVVPIDKAAPKGRLILPQQQIIRDILDAGGIPLVSRDTEYAEALSKLKNTPKLVITDSQVFKEIAEKTPPDAALTSFSILFARYKGVLESSINGAKAIDTIRDGDKILISEGCTHHRQGDDIGTIKLPKLIEKYTGKKPVYEFSSGGEFPADLSKYKLIIHCGGCMLNNREMAYRNSLGLAADVPITNYGVAIGYMQGILPRCISCFGDKGL